MNDIDLGTLAGDSTAAASPAAAKGGPPWNFSTYGQWRAANDGNLDLMWEQIGNLQQNTNSAFRLTPENLQKAGQSFGMNSDQLLRGLFELQATQGLNTAGTWDFDQRAGGYLAPAYLAGWAYKQLDLPNADAVVKAIRRYQDGPWSSYVNNVQDAQSKAQKGNDFWDFIMRAAPIALAAIGLPEFLAQFGGGTAMTADLATADAMAGLIPASDVSSWAGMGAYGDLGGYGGGANWGDLSLIGDGGWGDLGGYAGGADWGNLGLSWGDLGGYAGGADWGSTVNSAPVTNLDRPYMDWGRPDMGSTFANWLDNPMAALRKLRGMSPLAKSGGPLQSGWNILSGLQGIGQSRRLADLASRASERADPFGAYRAGYAQQLAALSANPSLITKQPGYAAGLEAVRRSMAAQGYQGSGNMMAALAQYGQKFLGDEQNRLAMLAGAGFNPASAGQLNLEGNVSANQLLFTALNRLGGGIWQALA